MTMGRLTVQACTLPERILSLFTTQTLAQPSLITLSLVIQQAVNANTMNNVFKFSVGRNKADVSFVIRYLSPELQVTFNYTFSNVLKFCVGRNEAGISLKLLLVRYLSLELKVHFDCTFLMIPV